MSQIAQFGNYMPLADRVKYPKTMHFPWSPGLQNDDRVLQDTHCFDGKRIVMSEKLDGENTTLYRDCIHARSVMDISFHPSRSWIQALHGRIRSEIPEGWRICGENMYAKHSIHYHNLASYFYVFSIWNSSNVCLSWNETMVWCDLLELSHVPLIHRGYYEETVIKDAGYWYMNYPDLPQNVEGYVVRTASQFHYDDFQSNVAKYVRRNHVQTSEHWLNEPLVKNELQSS